MTFPAVFPWRTSLLVIHGNIILREIGAGWLVCPAAGWAPGEGETGGNAGPGTFSSLRGRPEVESSVGFNSNSGWNTHKPPTSSRGCSLGLRSGDFGRAGALCQPPPTEPASSESLERLEHMEKDPENREKEVLWLPSLLPLGAFRCSESVWPFHLMAQPGLVPPVPSGVSPCVEVILIETREEN